MDKLDYAIVYVSDMKRSIEFYRDVLGLPLKFESPDWTEFDTQGTVLALHPGTASKTSEEPQSWNPAGRCELGFMVKDLDAFHKHMKSKGVLCLEAPRVLEYGMRLARYADPDGLAVSIGEPKT